MTRRGALTGLALAGLGVVAGWLAAHLLEPTNADIRAAARALVPPGFETTKFESGYVGNLPTRGPYKVRLETRGGGAPDERERAVRRVAASSGWSLARREEYPNAFELTYLRRGVEASLDVRLVTDTTVFRTSRHGPTQTRRRRICMLTGVVIAVGLWALIRRLRQRPSTKPGT